MIFQSAIICLKKLLIKNINGYDFLKSKISDITSISAQIGSIKFDIRSSWLNPEKIRKIIIVGKKKCFYLMNLILKVL